MCTILSSENFFIALTYYFEFRELSSLYIVADCGSSKMFTAYRSHILILFVGDF